MIVLVYDYVFLMILTILLVVDSNVLLNVSVACSSNENVTYGDDHPYEMIYDRSYGGREILIGSVLKSRMTFDEIVILNVFLLVNCVSTFWRTIFLIVSDSWTYVYVMLNVCVVTLTVCVISTVCVTLNVFVILNETGCVYETLIWFVGMKSSYL